LNELTAFQVDLIVPQQCYDALHETVTRSSRQPCYSRVTMALGQILQGSFFTEYVKTGMLPTRSRVPVPVLSPRMQATL